MLSSISDCIAVPMEITGTVFVGIVGAVVAVWGVFTQRAIAARRATIDFIARSEADHDLMAARKRFIMLAKAGGLSPYAAIDKEGTPDTEVIRIVLNEFELVAIGIQRGILDYTIYSRWMKSEANRYWNHALPFITELRTRLHNDEIYKEFEVLQNWLKADSAPTRSFWWGRLF